MSAADEHTFSEPLAQRVHLTPAYPMLTVPTSTKPGTAIVVVERGGRWPQPARSARLGADDVVVVAQQQDEAPGIFARRVMRKLAKLERGARRVHTGLIAAAPHADDSTLDARSLVAASLLRALHDDGEIVVSVSEGANRDALRHVAALEDVLDVQLGLRRPALRVETSTEESGVFKRPTAPVVSAA